MRFIHLTPTFLLLVIVALLIQSCKPTVEEGETIVNVPQPSEEAIALTVQGWTAFEQKDYPKALSLFHQATGKNDLYADAYNGLAWTYARMDSMPKSLQYFDIALGLNFNLIDAYAGRSFVNLALGEYREAISAVQRVQDVGPPFYLFRHDLNVSINDLLLVKAQSYFLLQDYTAAQELIDRLDPENLLDDSSPSYVEDLALEIETLWSRI